jgi:hypothetical protein
MPKTREELLAALELLEDFAEDGCGDLVYSAEDVDSLIIWAEGDSEQSAEEVLKEARKRQRHFGR